MPTFKNTGTRPISYTGKIRGPDGKDRDSLIIFDPNKEVQLEYWVPYQKLGLEVTNENYPAVPSSVLISGTFSFDDGTERKYNIEPCDMYSVDVILQKGKAIIYAGNSATGAEISADGKVPYQYSAVYDWEYAPYLKIVGKAAGTEATVHAEARNSSRISGAQVWG